MRLRTSSSLILALSLAALVVGWRAFWFLTDDAYIAFRYVSNSVLGHGYVWNAPPFMPVEGYTSFLWVVILDLVWRLTGIEPPTAANPLLLACSAATLLLTAWMVQRLPLRAELESWRPLWLALVLAYVVSNRTFLTFASSGLEAALFNLLLTAWVALARSTAPNRSWRWLALCTVAALSALARPDGLLFALATALLLIVQGPPWRPRLLAAWPLLLVPTHLLWRWSFYGEWLPNTYYAKHVAAWPESGARYLFCFVVEYGLACWFALLLWWLVQALRRVRLTFSLHHLGASAAPLLVVGALTAHAGYYVFIIGGDHFEYRVLSQLIPFLALSALWLTNQVVRTRLAAACALTLLAGASLPIPWTHFALSQPHTTRKATVGLKVPISPSFPRWLHWLTRPFDDAQAWLTNHGVCARHQEHKVFWLHQLATSPTREAGSALPPEGFPVAAIGTVGVPGWVLPQVNIIDALGLNDRVIARTPPYPGAERVMAHDRHPLAGYLECFRPNVRWRVSPPRVIPRRQALTAADIRGCESKPWPTPPPLSP